MRLTEPDLQMYFLAIVPPEPIRGAAHELKIHFRETYGSKAALHSPPHLTLHMPFRWKQAKESKIHEACTKAASLQRPFQLTLKNFNAFPPRVIFIDVVQNNELINFQKNLQGICRRDLNLLNAQYKDLPFHPHLTLAFRDLKKEQFRKAWEEFMNKTFEAEFVVNELTLLKHNGRNWDIHQQFKLMDA